MFNFNLKVVEMCILETYSTLYGYWIIFP